LFVDSQYAIPLEQEDDHWENGFIYT